MRTVQPIVFRFDIAQVVADLRFSLMLHPDLPRRAGVSLRIVRRIVAREIDPCPEILRHLEYTREGEAFLWYPRCKQNQRFFEWKGGSYAA